MKLNQIILLIIAGFFLSVTAKAQQVTPLPAAPLLTIRQAVELALQNNYAIKISTNNRDVAKNNTSLGNAGFFPVVTADVTVSNSIQNVNQTRADATGALTSTSVSGARNSGITYGPNLNWTIFNGLYMFAAYDRFKELQKLGDVRLRDTIQGTVAAVLSSYYNLVNQTQQIKALQGAIAISRTQLRYAQAKFQVGRVSKLDVLNAQVNLNTDTANLITQVQEYKSAQIQLNELLVRNPRTEFSVSDTILVDDQLKLGDILSQAQAQNPAVLSAEINKRLAETNLRLIRSTRYPQVAVNAGYIYTSNKNPTGFARVQNSNGLNYGLTASVNIFNGFSQWRRERNAKLQLANSDLSEKQIRLDIEAQISNFYVSYLSGLDLIKLGQSNVEIARKNLEISLEKYRIGNITPLEIREAQRNYLDAQSKFFAAQYQSKIAEVTLRQLTNSINI
jgi:outer membrane protein